MAIPPAGNTGILIHHAVNIVENIEETDEPQTNHTGFKDLYIDVRGREKRIVTDCQLMFLPDIDPSHIHYREWQLRKRSSQRLIAYLTKKNKALNILEIGCGNGWLSSKLSAIPCANVTGLDINGVEINQAKRIFHKQNLEFIEGTFKPGMFKDHKFDVILFAAAIQYFPSVKNILDSAMIPLTKNGEIHIIDTHFYTTSEIDGAARRTAEYYANLGYSEMSAHYFHHTLSDILLFKHRMPINPRRFFNRIVRKEFFHWIVITQ